MVMDSDFWKKKYSKDWDLSSKREHDLAERIQHNTHCTVEYVGLGAGSKVFLHGSAEANGFNKGDPDLHIAETNIYVEVTGPLQGSVGSDKPLWVRPDKVTNAINHLDKRETFIAHNCPSASLWRVICIDEDFVAHQSKFHMVHPLIGGSREEYIEIPPDNACVHGIEYLYRVIEMKLENITESTSNSISESTDTFDNDGGPHMALSDFAALMPTAKIRLFRISSG